MLADSQTAAQNIIGILLLFAGAAVVLFVLDPLPSQVAPPSRDRRKSWLVGFQLKDLPYH